MLMCRITLLLEDTIMSLHSKREEVISVGCLTHSFVSTVHGLDLMGANSSCPRSMVTLYEMSTYERSLK